VDPDRCYVTSAGTFTTIPRATLLSASPKASDVYDSASAWNFLRRFTDQYSADYFVYTRHKAERFCQLLTESQPTDGFSLIRADELVVIQCQPLSSGTRVVASFRKSGDEFSVKMHCPGTPISSIQTAWVVIVSPSGKKIIAAANADPSTESFVIHFAAALMAESGEWIFRPTAVTQGGLILVGKALTLQR
jgi:hypothetical protein